MTDPPTSHRTDVDTAVEHGPRSTPRATRWQKVVGIIGLVVVLLVGIQTVAAAVGAGGFGDHEPGGSSLPEVGDDGDQTRSTGPQGGHQPPPWVPDHG